MKIIYCYSGVSFRWIVSSLVLRLCTTHTHYLLDQNDHITQSQQQMINKFIQMELHGKK